MAYCKSCGNPIKDDAKRCEKCGAKVDQVEVVDESQVEIVRQAKPAGRRIRFAKDAYEETLVERTFEVFDRKLVLTLFVVLAAMILGFFIRTVGDNEIDLRSIIEAILVAAPMLMFLVACVIRNRGAVLVSLIAISVAMAAYLVLTSVFFNVTSPAAVILSVVNLCVQFCVMGTTVTLTVEMLTGRRLLGVHCALVILLSIGLLAHIILTLMVMPEGQMGVLVTLWQIVTVFSKVLLLCVMLFLFSNLGKIGLNTKF